VAALAADHSDPARWALAAIRHNAPLGRDELRFDGEDEP
jgi:hypothetical protein